MKKFTSFLLMFIAALLAWQTCHGDDKGTAPNLEKDSLILHDPLSFHPAEFRRALERHFPVAQIIEGGARKEVLEKIKQASIMATDHATARIVNGKVNTGWALCMYFSVMLKSNCPKEERLFFCQFVDGLLKLWVESDDEHCMACLSMIFSDAWMGWFSGPGGWADARSAINAWHASEIYRHLANDVPATSRNLKEKVDSVAKRERELAK